MERIINFIKKVKDVFLAWDYYGRGKPLPHNDDVKQKRLVKSKLKRAHSVLHVIQRNSRAVSPAVSWNDVEKREVRIHDYK